MRYADRDRHGADQPNQHNNPEQRHHTTKDTSRRIAQLRCTALKLLTIASWADVDHSCWSLDVECRYCRRRGPGLMLKELIPEPWDVVGKPPETLKRSSIRQDLIWAPRALLVHY